MILKGNSNLLAKVVTLRSEVLALKDELRLKSIGMIIQYYGGMMDRVNYAHYQIYYIN